MRPVHLFAALCAFAASRLEAQASSTIPPVRQQIAEAVTPLPDELRAGAAVLGYNADGKLVSMREGKNDMICLAPDPTAKDFHSACYHRGMEPFMARGRALREQGVKGAQVDTVRFAEVKSGKLKMPTQPTMLYQIFGGTFDPATEKVTGGRWLYVTYIPFASPATTGLSAKPSEKGPWIMFPGTPKAHIMFTVGM
ncbi:MAG: hypothetical protein JWM41_3143 [Gemmatimonadetes bacterium]|nr:hypothetical protein [Gemmatimonadota bacterium]